MPDKSSHIKRADAERIISSVLSKVETSRSAIAPEAIYQDLRDLKLIIDQTRADIGATGAADISEKHIKTATDELDAVVDSTAEATGAIMDACDNIQEHCGSVEGDASLAIADQVTKIYEACSFQDLTGQRITKVVSSLKAIEDKVNSILGVLGETIPGIDKVSGASEDERKGDEALLNGPQMAGQAISQEEIDRMLAEFDDE